MYDGALADLIDQFGQLPGIGPKSAQRMAMHVLDADPEEVARLVEAINAVRGRVRHCDVCANLTEDDQCSICRDVRRDPSQICVVQEPKDIQAIEGARVFRGRYHVLGGVIDPIHGIGPDQLNIASLMSRLADGTVTEVILATPTSRARLRPPTWRACSPRWASKPRAWRWGYRWAETWSTPTRSPWAAPWRDAGDCSRPR